MTLIEILQQACAELALPAPSAAIGATDDGPRQMTALLWAAGSALCWRANWRQLLRSWEVTTSGVSSAATTTAGSATLTGVTQAGQVVVGSAVNGPGIPQLARVVSVTLPGTVVISVPATASGSATLQFWRTAYPVPADWLRPVDQTQWDVTGAWPLSGPTGSQHWHAARSALAHPGVRHLFRLEGRDLVFFPPPAPGLRVVSEYVSSHWIRTPAGGTADRFAADGDLPVFDGPLLVRGLIAAWRRANGFSDRDDAQAYLRLTELAIDQNTGAEPLSLMGGVIGAHGVLNPGLLPDGNWPGP